MARIGFALGMTASCGMSDDSSTEGTEGTEATELTDATESTAVCADGETGDVWKMRCLAHVQVDHATGRFVAHLAAPQGYGADALQSAYKIDPTKTYASKPTVAVVNAFGYAALESDLAIYRTQYGLPSCTVANGCLTIVNQTGSSSGLPADPPAGNDWTIEAALDLDMVSAACPLCRILIVEANSDSSTDLFAAENAAASLAPDVISNSWGGPEQGNVQPFEKYFDHGDIAIFTAAGDQGYNDQFAKTAGPDYPGTSAHVIAVGATRLTRSLTTSRGWAESAWAVSTGGTGTTAGGSACSTSIAKPSYQSESPCTFKATTDIAAVGDPQTGVAVYNAANAGWVTVGGTSSASPFVAGIWAATGNGKQISGAFLAAHTSALYDVVGGSNGTCDGSSKLCNAVAGWDGPTGYGTPNATALMALGGGGGSGSGSGSGSGDGGGGGCAVGGGAGLIVALGSLLARRRRRC